MLLNGKRAIAAFSKQNSEIRNDSSTFAFNSTGLPFVLATYSGGGGCAVLTTVNHVYTNVRIGLLIELNIRFAVNATVHNTRA